MPPAIAQSGLREGDLEAAGPERVRAVDNGRSRSAGVEPEADSRLDSRAISDTEVTPAAWATLLPAGRRGAGPAVRHSVARLQAGAGNAAVAGLLDGRTDARATRRVGPALRRSGNTDLEGGTPTGADRPEAAAQAEDAAPVDDEALPPPTSSFTKIGAPSYSAYTVSGTLRQAAEAIAGRPEAGQATAAPDLKAAVNDKGTRMVHAQVTVALAVLLPEWDGKASATPNQRAEWDRFKAAITAHEAAHVEIDKASFAGAHSKILAKKTLAESYAQYDTIVGEAKAANDTFDGDAHGRPATNINPNIDEVTKVP